MRLVGACDRWQCLHVGPQIRYIGDIHPGIGGIGKGRVIVGAVGGYARKHGVGEVRAGPCADSGFAIRRNVGGHKDAGGGVEAMAATKQFLFVALGTLYRMARSAPASPENLLTACGISIIHGCQQAVVNAFGDCQNPENQRGRNAYQEQCSRETFHVVPQFSDFPQHCGNKPSEPIVLQFCGTR